MKILHNLSFSCVAPPACHGRLPDGFNCMANHPTHDDLRVTASAGDWQFPIRVFDWEKYGGTGNYCPGHEESHHALIVHGTWEQEETNLVMETLRAKPGLVLDLGANVGWFSLIAAKCDCDVIAFEAEGENIRLLRVNAAENDLTDKITPVHVWIDQRTPQLPATDVALVKIDLEGHDRLGVRMCRHIFEQQLARHALIEFSPVFGPDYTDGYTALAMQMIKWGYTPKLMPMRAAVSEAEVPDLMKRLPQMNLWFERNH